MKKKYLIPKIGQFILSVERKSFRILFIVILSISSLISFSQESSKECPGGALFLSEEEYAKLPRPDWGKVQKNPDCDALFVLNTTSIKMLVTPPVGNQGNQASCVGWSTSTALGILSYPKYNCWDIAQRSPSYIYNQIKYSTCSSGASIMTGINLVIDQGSTSIRLMPYNQSDCSTQPNSNQVFEASYHKAMSKLILDRNDVTSMKTALNNGYPVIIGFFWNQSVSDMWYGGDGIWDVNYGAPEVGHAVCIVGYDDGQQMFRVQNSMGTVNGDNGFFWVTYNLVSNNCLQEAYVISGMTSGYPETITGPTPNLVCLSGATFILNNPPSGCTITWDKSDNLDLYSSSNNSAVFKAKPSASGTGWVQAIVNSCSFTIPKFYTWVGPPQVTNQKVDGSTYYPGKQICPGNHWLTVTPIGEGAGNASWTVPSGIQYFVGTNMLDFTFPWSWSSISISARSSNSCGTSTNANFYLTKKTYGCGGYFSMYPNPASDEVTIMMNEPEIIVTEDIDISDELVLKAIPSNPTNYTIRIYNNLGTLVSTAIRTGTSFTISLVNLRDGSYLIEVSDGKNSCREQLIIKRK